MTRRHHPEPEVYYQRQRSSPMTMSRGGPLGYSLVQRASSNPTQVETDSKGNPRKRIAVACSRCRRRKIKCSGDRGDGQGCTNCKNSANGASGPCQFLRVSSQDLGSFYNDMNGPPGGYAPSNDMSYYTTNYYQQAHTIPTTPQTRMPRHYASNIYYTPHPVTLMPETPSRSAEAILDGFSYSNTGPSNYNSCYQGTVYNQADSNQYYSQNTGFQQRAAVDNNGFRYPSVPLSQMHGPNGTDGHSSFSTMDTLAHSLPGPGATQRTLPAPPGKAEASDMSHIGPQQQQPQQPVLKSQGIGSYGSYPSTAALLPPTSTLTAVLNETSSADMIDAYPRDRSHVHAHPQSHSHAHGQQRSSLRSNASNSFSTFGFPSSVSSTSDSGGGHLPYYQQHGTNPGVEIAHAAVPVSGEHEYGGQMYRSSLALDPPVGGGGCMGTGGSSSNASSMQYTVASSKSSKRGSQGSLFATYDDVESGTAGRRESVGSPASGESKKWE